MADDRYEQLISLRERAKEGRDPTAADETLALLCDLVQKLQPERVLEIGAGEGLTSIALLIGGAARLTAIECDAERARRARENFAHFGLADRVTLIEDDAGRVLPALEEDGAYGLIFLDGPKAQYRRYFADCKRLLESGGVLVSDDILLFGYVTGEPPKKRKMLAEHIREYIAMLQSDPAFETEILPFGEGVAVSRKL